MEDFPTLQGPRNSTMGLEVISPSVVVEQDGEKTLKTKIESNASFMHFRKSWGRVRSIGDIFNVRFEMAQGIVFVLDCISQSNACQDSTVNHKPAHHKFFKTEKARKPAEKYIQVEKVFYHKYH